MFNNNKSPKVTETRSSPNEERTRRSLYPRQTTFHRSTMLQQIKGERNDTKSKQKSLKKEKKKR